MNLTAPSVNSRIPAAYNDFGFRLFARLTEQDAGRNVFISPFSIAQALSMTYNGAAQRTQRAMEQTLGLEKIDQEAVNAAAASLLAALAQPDEQVQLAIANSLWAGKRWPIKSDFIETCRTAYRAEVRNVDFTAPDTADVINAWIKQQTRDRIDRLVRASDLKALTMLVLLNAIYFKGNWTVPFDPAITDNANFHLLNGETKRVRLMYQSGHYLYAEDETCQAVSLPYGSGRISLMIFLPSLQSSLADFRARLTADTWHKWLKRCAETPGHLALPRFKLEYEQSLKESLTALGMGVAFSDAADFSQLSDVPAFISFVRHKAVLEVNEEGTVAAAATAVGIQAKSAPARSFQMTIDRPFFCTIADNPTGTILFMGSIVEPQ